MRTHPAAALLGAVLLVPACGVLCQREAIRGTLPMPLVSGEDALTDTMAGNFESDRDENAELDALEDAIAGRTLAGRGVSMWLQRGLDHTLNVSLRLPTPLRTGDVLPVVGVHSPDQPFWGTIANPPAGLSVGVRLDDFVATAATGSARVVGLSPLRLELDVVASGSGRQAAIDGTLTVRHESSTESCFQ
jgi:hypothetical protein